MRSSKVIFSGWGDESELEKTVWTWGGLRRGQTLVSMPPASQTAAWTSKARDARAARYLHWSRAVLLSCGLRGELRPEAKSPEDAAASAERTGETGLSGDSSGKGTGEPDSASEESRSLLRG